jgi:acyl-CoA reductase-like NAD-dependent aldehyde dehydrogenase
MNTQKERDKVFSKWSKAVAAQNKAWDEWYNADNAKNKEKAKLDWQQAYRDIEKYCSEVVRLDTLLEEEQK